MFRTVASWFSDSAEYEFEVTAAGASGDLAYTIGYEHNQVKVERSVADLHVARHARLPARGRSVANRAPARRRPAHRRSADEVTHHHADQLGDVVGPGHDGRGRPRFNSDREAGALRYSLNRSPARAPDRSDPVYMIFVTLPVRDLARARAFYEALGVQVQPVLLGRADGHPRCR